MKYSISSEFEALIGAIRLDGLNSHPGSVYGLDSNLDISCLNPGWFKFAEENGDNIFVSDEWSLGRNIFDCIPKVLKSFYKGLYETTLNEKKSTIIPRQSEYECSSPGLCRSFSMHLYPVGKAGVVVVNSLVVEKPHTAPPVEGQNVFDENDYVDKNGMVHQCANCRRIQRLSNPGQWYWVPKYIKTSRKYQSRDLHSL